MIKLGRRKARLDARSRSTLGWGGPPLVGTFAAFTLQRGAMSWRVAHVVSASFTMGEAVDMTVRAAAVHPADGFWGDSCEMEATGGVVP